MGQDNGSLTKAKATHVIKGGQNILDFQSAGNVQPLSRKKGFRQMSLLSSSQNAGVLSTPF